MCMGCKQHSPETAGALCWGLKSSGLELALAAGQREAAFPCSLESALQHKYTMQLVCKIRQQVHLAAGTAIISTAQYRTEHTGLAILAMHDADTAPSN